MANVNTTARPRIAQASEPTIYNLSMPLANTEYSLTFSNNTKKFLLRMRTPAVCKVAFASGETVTKYITVNPMNSYSEDGLDLVSITIYLSSSVSGQVAEILEWV